jgi:hypothetical protein
MLPDFLEKEEATAEVPNDEELGEIAALAFQQVQWENTIARLTKELANATAGLKNIQEKALPDAMATAGLSKFTLTNGMSIEVKKEVFPSISAANEKKAFKWLTDNGFGDVVKDEVKVPFGKGEAAKALVLMTWAKAQGFAATEKLSVHAGTLKALVKEQRARGVEFPADCFSIFDLSKTVVKTK